VLEGLSRVDWDALTRAGGAASDIPDALRALLSEDASVRRSAMLRLSLSLCPDGDVFETSLHAVPFLLELLAAPGIPEKAEILLLLVALAEGGFPDRFDVAAGRLLKESDTPEARREVAERRRLPGRVRAAVRAGRATYRALLTAAAREERSAALHVLATACAGDGEGDAAEIAAALRRRRDAEPDRVLRAALVRFLAAFRPLEAATQAFLVGIRTGDPDPLARLAAAAALAHGVGNRAPVGVEDDLIGALERAEPEIMGLYKRVVSHDERVDAEAYVDLALGLRQMGERGIAAAAPRLERLLGARCAQKLRNPPGDIGIGRVVRDYVTRDGTRLSGEAAGRFIFPQTLALEAADTLLTLCFGPPLGAYDPDREAGHPAFPLTPMQRRALHAVADCKAIWYFAQNVADMLYDRRLPDTRDELRRYLARMDV
jgi:hypothetical protein